MSITNVGSKCDFKPRRLEQFTLTRVQVQSAHFDQYDAWLIMSEIDGPTVLPSLTAGQ